VIDDVLVLGAGVIGLSLADALAQEGLRVRVLDADRIGGGASGAAAGMLAPISEVLVHRGADPDDPLLPLGLESLSRFESLARRLRDETGVDVELERSGLWHPVCSETEWTEAAAGYARLGERAGAVEWLSGRALAEAAPGFAETIRGAFFSPLECHLRPPLLVRALAASLRARGGDIEEGVAAHRLHVTHGRIEGVETSAGPRRAARVVVASGPWTSAILGDVAPVSLPEVEPVRGQILAFEPPLPAVREIVFARDAYCVPKRDGSWIIGATEERVGFDRRVTAEGVALLVERARALFPTIEAATFVRAWAGLRPVSTSGWPQVGAVPGVDGLYMAAGHARNGVLLAPITAERLRDVLLGKRPSTTDALAPDPIAAPTA